MQSNGPVTYHNGRSESAHTGHCHFALVPTDQVFARLSGDGLNFGEVGLPVANVSEV